MIFGRFISRKSTFSFVKVNVCALLRCFSGDGPGLFCPRILDLAAPNKMASNSHGEGFLQIGDNQVYAWSISGLETCVVVKNPAFTVCFDMGIACRQSLKCDQVFISHGHMDHIAGVPLHVNKRNLFGLPPAKYYVPEHLSELLKEVCHSFRQIHESNDALDRVNVIPVKPEDRIEIPGGHHVVPFRTVHRVTSQGYLLYKRYKCRKPEFQDLKGIEIGAKVREGVEVFEYVTVPEVAFTGDTTFEMFELPPPDDLLKVKLLIVEATYIDDDDQKKDMLELARDRGHIHLFELIRNAELFKDIENILLIHFSDKYSAKEINDRVYKALPLSLGQKVHVATLAKEKS